MVAPGKGSAFKNVFYTIGYTLGRAEAHHDAPGARSAEALDVPRPAVANVPERDAVSGGDGRVRADARAVPEYRSAGAAAGATPATHPRLEAEPAVGTAIGLAATSWLLARLFRPRPIHWPRAILAGIVGTALTELASAARERLASTSTAGPVTPTRVDTSLPSPATASGNAALAPPPRYEPYGPLDYAAGIATAAAYAALLYPRLPGRPLTRGLIFGALEAVAAPLGGTFAALRRLSPHIALPIEALTPITGLADRDPLAPLAFGLALGLYRGADDET